MPETKHESKMKYIQYIFQSRLSNICPTPDKNSDGTSRPSCRRSKTVRAFARGLAARASRAFLCFPLTKKRWSPQKRIDLRQAPKSTVMTTAHSHTDRKSFRHSAYRLYCSTFNVGLKMSGFAVCGIRPNSMWAVWVTSNSPAVHGPTVR